MSVTTAHPPLAIPPTAAGHFKLYFYAAILQVIDRLIEVSDSHEAVFERFPFLVGYVNELARSGLDGQSTTAARASWRERVLDWEARTSAFLPLRALRTAAGLSYETLVAYFCLGLAEEDPRFG